MFPKCLKITKFRNLLSIALIEESSLIISNLYLDYTYFWNVVNIILYLEYVNVCLLHMSCLNITKHGTKRSWKLCLTLKIYCSIVKGQIILIIECWYKCSHIQILHHCSRLSYTAEQIIVSWVKRRLNEKYDVLKYYVWVLNIDNFILNSNKTLFNQRPSNIHHIWLICKKKIHKSTY